mgnify:CR=1 FL=1
MEFLDEDFTVLLYYQYCLIEDPVAIQKWQQEVCEALDLKGRIRISPEGLNGTLGGSQADVEAYILSFDLFPELEPASIHWKVSKATKRWADDPCMNVLLPCTASCVSSHHPHHITSRCITSLICTTGTAWRTSAFSV